MRSFAEKITDGRASALNEAVEIIEGRDAAGVLFLCDHASNAVPDDLESLGLPASEFERHIAYDLGAAAMTRRLAARFGAPAILTRFSRLVIDPNRGADDPTLVMRISDGIIVPGNARVDAREIARRLALYWRPYREAVAARLDRMLAAGPVPAIVSVHSFTESWKGRPRPWQAGVLWDCDPRLPLPLIASLRAEGLIVGDNQPYDGALAGDTLDAHANSRGLANVLVELRQDLLAAPGAQEAWAERLAAHLRPILERADVHRIERYISRNESRRLEGSRI